jgi:hypothetical protein
MRFPENSVFRKLNEVAEMAGGLNWSMQHHLDESFF